MLQEIKKDNMFTEYKLWRKTLNTYQSKSLVAEDFQSLPFHVLVRLDGTYSYEYVFRPFEKFLNI